MVERQSWYGGSLRMKIRQTCQVFIDQVKQVGYKAIFKCVEGRR